MNPSTDSIKNENRRTYEDLFSLPIEDKLPLLNKQIAYARANSSFYSYLPDAPLKSLDDFKSIPTISCKNLQEHLDEMTCTPPWKIKRMVTLMTSGSTAEPKRLAFSEDDLEGTVEFFCHGMHCLCDCGDSVAIFMPGSNPDGLCDLLSRGIARFGGKPLVYGIVHDFSDATEFLLKNQPAVLVGFPVQIRQLALMLPDYRPKCVLLSADYCAQSAIATIEKYWKCRAFVHYGITESGLGCAVETPAEEGMIPRGDVLLGVSEDGELLLTTLKMEALPLIRYRTGDLAAIREDGNLIRVMGRIDEIKGRVSITLLDEILLAKDEILNYEAELNGSTLEIRILGRKGCCLDGLFSCWRTELSERLNNRRERECQTERQTERQIESKIEADEVRINLYAVEEICFTGKRLIRD